MLTEAMKGAQQRSMRTRAVKHGWEGYEDLQSWRLQSST